MGARAEAVADDAEAINYTTNLKETIPFKNDYFQVYPSSFLTYTPTDQDSYQTSISRRLDRLSYTPRYKEKIEIKTKNLVEVELCKIYFTQFGSNMTSILKRSTDENSSKGAFQPT